MVTARSPDTWRFELQGVGAVPDSLQPLVGEVVQLTSDTVVFRLAGSPGERVAFRFALRDTR